MTIKSIEKLKVRAECGDPVAEYEMGLAYSPMCSVAHDYGVEANIEISLEWLTSAAGHGHLPAIMLVAMAYHQGSGGVPQNVSKAIEWYLKAAVAGDVQAMRELGLIALQDGQIDAAASWLHRAAVFGDTIAFQTLRECARQGLLPSMDLKTEIELLEAAVASGKDPDAFSALADKHERGEGVPTDWVKAYVYFTLVSYAEEGKGERGHGVEGVARIRAKLTAAQELLANDLLATEIKRLSGLGD